MHKLDSCDLGSNIDSESDTDNETEEDLKAVNEDKGEDDKDGKEPWMIGQEEMVNTSADDVNNMVVDHQIVLPEQGQELRKHTRRPQPLEASSQPQTPEPQLQPLTQATLANCGLDNLGSGMP